MCQSARGAVAAALCALLVAQAAVVEDDDLDSALDELKKLEHRFERRKRQVLEEVPFFSLNIPLKEYVERSGPEESGGRVIFRFFEPRYVMMASQVEQGSRVYGYADSYPPKPGSLGTLVDTNDGPEGPAYHWLGSRAAGPVVVVGRPGPAFRVVSVKKRAAPGGEGAPLYLGKVALIPEEERPEGGDAEYSRKQLVANALLSRGIVVEEEELEEAGKASAEL
mmetsp:Transcript_18518/g.57349  ORF Transcript_18518/g.57349 Transcript_18518/m.57349 type:complete len:223 (-) Transcript_18518:57-725(-)